MDQLDAEHILFHWGEASEDDRRAAALYGVYELDVALTDLEAQLPVISEKVCSGLATVLDFPSPNRGAHRCSAAIISWIRTYPDLEDEWKALGLRALAVLGTLAALDPSGPWSPPGTDERTG